MKNEADVDSEDSLLERYSKLAKSTYEITKLLNKRIDELEEENEDLQIRNEELEDRVTDLEQIITGIKKEILEFRHEEDLHTPILLKRAIHQILYENYTFWEVLENRKWYVEDYFLEIYSHETIGGETIFTNSNGVPFQIQTGYPDSIYVQYLNTGDEGNFFLVHDMKRNEMIDAIREEVDGVREVDV